MIPGADQIIACPKCAGLAKYMTLVSGNTFGARIWTDGKQIAPMLPRPPVVVKCRNCAGFYWLAEADEIGTFYPQGEGGEEVNPDWTAAQMIEEPTEDDYYQAIEEGFAINSEQERSLRVLAWWRRNDAFRDIAQKQVLEGANAIGVCRENLEVLRHLLTAEDDNDRFMKVEVLRELGEFESALQVLSLVNSPELDAVVHQFRSLCDDRDTCVRELRFSS
jgi:hypothetical protein